MPEKPKCNHYGYRHFGECRRRSGACFGCGSKEHRLRDCPRRAGDQRASARVYHLAKEESESPSAAIEGNLVKLIAQFFSCCLGCFIWLNS